MPITSAALRRHRYLRPLWICAECSARWPCQPAKLGLLAEYRQARIGLTLLMVATMYEALPELMALEAGTHAVPENLWLRFVLWTRHGSGTAAPRP